MGSNFWLMVNPFRKCLVTGISERNRTGLTAPIRIDPMSMHRHGPSVCRSPLMVEHKPMVDRFHMIVGHVIKRLVGQVRGSFKQPITQFFAHVRIFVQGQGVGYSYFPMVHVVHGATVGVKER